jgi:5-methylcytosine-specific restriction endonuclease McrA
MKCYTCKIEKSEIEFYAKEHRCTGLNGNLKQLFIRDMGKCQMCESTENIQVDHIFPISLGGDLIALENLQLLCRSCNTFKRNHVMLPNNGGLMITQKGA